MNAAAIAADIQNAATEAVVSVRFQELGSHAIMFSVQCAEGVSANEVADWLEDGLHVQAWTVSYDRHLVEFNLATV